jgi:hypothetical protein
VAAVHGRAPATPQETRQLIGLTGRLDGHEAGPTLGSPTS